MDQINEKLDKILNNLQEFTDRVAGLIKRKVDFEKFAELENKVLRLEQHYEQLKNKTRQEQLSKDAYSKRFNLLIHGLS